MSIYHVPIDLHRTDGQMDDIVQDDILEYLLDKLADSRQDIAGVSQDTDPESYAVCIREQSAIIRARERLLALRDELVADSAAGDRGLGGLFAIHYLDNMVPFRVMEFSDIDDFTRFHAWFYRGPFKQPGTMWTVSPRIATSYRVESPIPAYWHDEDNRERFYWSSKIIQGSQNDDL